MSKSSRLQTDMLFQALTRPTMIAGVSYMYFCINGYSYKELYCVVGGCSYCSWCRILHLP